MNVCKKIDKLVANYIKNILHNTPDKFYEKSQNFKGT